MVLASPIEELLTLEQVTKLYGVKRSTLYRYIQKGYLSTYRRAMDKRVYVLRAEMETLRRFRATESPGGPSLAAVQRARDFQQRVFGERQLSEPSAELIAEARRERDGDLP
ncbi:MAG: helix-turn-helix domain-containing protein [Dehalococcoidia bacterium]|nr:helix-turn-helix domain-containing protein [Dehalococcoidia bacterium]